MTVEEELAEMKAKFADAVKSRDDSKAKITAMETGFAEAKTKLDELVAADTTRKAKEEEERKKVEQEQLTNKGEFDKAIKVNEEKHTKELARLRSSFNTVHIPRMIEAAAGGIENITKDAMKDLPVLLGARVRLDEETLQPMVIGDDGKQLKDDDLKPVSVDSYVKKFVEARPYMLVDKMPVGRGTKTPDTPVSDFTAENALKDQKVAIEWQKRDPDGFKKAFSDRFTPAAITERAKEAAMTAAKGG